MFLSVADFVRSFVRSFSPLLPLLSNASHTRGDFHSKARGNKTETEELLNFLLMVYMDWFGARQWQKQQLSNTTSPFNLDVVLEAAALLFYSCRGSGACS